MNKSYNFIKVTGIIFFSVIFFISAFSLPIEDLNFNKDSISKEIDSIMKKHVGISTPGGAVAVVKDGEIIFAKGYGLADIENEKPVIADETVFEYGSINKLFVWVSAMQLVEKNELDLDEYIAKYLPEEVRVKLKYTKPITFLDLMNHTAGFEDSMFNFAKKDMDNLSFLDETLKEHQPEQIFQPKEIISYSNYGSALGAYVIKQITGEMFFDYERKNIFAPAKMLKIAGHPLYKYNPELLKNKAKGYVPEEKGVFKETNWVYVPAYPSGAADGTVIALAKFALALTPEKPLDSPLFVTKEAFEEIFKKSYAPENIDTSVAHGFWEHEGKTPSFGHGGNTAGFSSFFSISPEERLGLVVLINSGAETDLIYELQELIFGKKEKVQVEGLTTPSSKEVIGKYLPARSSFENFLELFAYLSAYEISDIGPGEIKLEIPGHEAKYIQVAPYKYNIYEYSSLIIKNLYPELLFEKKEESIKRVTSGNSVDLIPGNIFKPWIFVNLTVIILGVSILFFLLNPILLIIYKFKNKVVLSRTLLFLNALGFAFIINNFLLIYIAFKYLYYSSHRVMPFIYGNIILAILSLITIIYFLVFGKKTKIDIYNKKNIYLYSIILFIFLTTLYSWNFMKSF